MNTLDDGTNSPGGRHIQHWAERLSRPIQLTTVRPRQCQISPDNYLTHVRPLGLLSVLISLNGLQSFALSTLLLTRTHTMASVA